MAKNSGVNWCDSAINPTDNCAGCELWNTKTKPPIRRCYAGKMYSRWHPKAVPFGDGVREHPGRMVECRRWPDLAGTERPEKPWLNGLPRLVFISDMSDAIWASFEYLYHEVIPVVRETPHLYLWPTKNPARMVEFAVWLEEKGWWPSNLIPGVSITSNATRGRMSVIAAYPGWPKRPFISYEPALEFIDLSNGSTGLFSWIAYGGESGVGTTPLAYNEMRKVINILQSSYLAPALFVKQRGGPDKLEALTDFPEDLRIRQYPAEWYSPNKELTR